MMKSYVINHICVAKLRINNRFRNFFAAFVSILASKRHYLTFTDLLYVINNNKVSALLYSSRCN